MIPDGWLTLIGVVITAAVGYAVNRGAQSVSRRAQSSTELAAAEAKLTAERTKTAELAAELERARVNTDATIWRRTTDELERQAVKIKALEDRYNDARGELDRTMAELTTLRRYLLNCELERDKATGALADQARELAEHKAQLALLNDKLAELLGLEPPLKDA